MRARVLFQVENVAHAVLLSLRADERLVRGSHLHSASKSCICTVLLRVLVGVAVGERLVRGLAPSHSMHNK